MKSQITLYVMFLTVSALGVGIFLSINVLGNLAEQLAFYESLNPQEALQVAGAELNCAQVDCQSSTLAKQALEDRVKWIRTGVIAAILTSTTLAGVVMWWGSQRLRQLRAT